MERRLAAGADDLPAGCGCGRFVDVQNVKRCALLCESKGNGLPDAAAAAGNDGYSAIEPEISRVRVGGQSETPRFQGMKSS
jgi:hypothetical protein